MDRVKSKGWQGEGKKLGDRTVCHQKGLPERVQCIE